jgi:asparagine synthase (glutamine-hydrolysing)
MRLMLESYPIEQIRVPGDDAWPLCAAGVWGANPSTPEDNPYRELKRRAYEAAATEGSRVVLNGGSADLLYRGGESWLWDLLREGRVVPAAVDLAQELKRRGLREGLRRSGVDRSLFQRSRGGRSRSKPEWLSSHAKGLIGDSAPVASPGRRPRQWSAVLGPRESRGISIEAFHAARAGVELRHPYRDRRLIEFMLAVPAHQLYARNRYKHIARNAMEGRLPEAIRTGEEPTLLTPLFRKGIEESERLEVDRLLDDRESIWPRYVSRAWLSQVRSQPRSRPLGEVVLWTCLAFELWVREAGRAWLSLPAAGEVAAVGAGA